MIRPLRELVLVVPEKSRELAEWEREMAGGSVHRPEERGLRRDWLGVGTLVAAGRGECVGACLEQPDIPLGTPVLFDNRVARHCYDVPHDGQDAVLLPSKALVATLDPSGPPGPQSIRPLGWYCLVREESAAFEAWLAGGRSAPPELWLPPAAAAAFEAGKDTKPKLQGGEVLATGAGVYLGPVVNPWPPGKGPQSVRDRFDSAVVRGWPDVQPGELLAYSAQTALGLELLGERFHFASAASEIAGHSAMVWGTAVDLPALRERAAGRQIRRSLGGW